MIPRHHIGADLLVAYAAGSLDEGSSLVVATHLALCPACRRDLALAEATAGALLDTLAPAPLDLPAETASLLATRQRIARGPAASHMKTSRIPDPAARPILPLPLRDYVGGDVGDLRWRTLGRGAAQVLIPTTGPTQARLLRIPAGQPVPEHGHRGRELTLVLSGSFHDGATLFARGDVEDADDETVHQPTATPDADCICLAVTEAPLRFRGWFLRLIQPVLGI